MESTMHTLNNLFAQLGLPSDDAAIESFIKTHNHLPSSLSLSQAPFWTATQAAFLCEEIINDADWAEVIDQLNAMLHTS